MEQRKQRKERKRPRNPKLNIKSNFQNQVKSWKGKDSKQRKRIRFERTNNGK